MQYRRREHTVRRYVPSLLFRVCLGGKTDLHCVQSTVAKSLVPQLVQDQEMCAN